MSAVCRKIINDSSSVKSLRLVPHCQFKRTQNGEKRESFVKDGGELPKIVIIIIKRFSVATTPKRRKRNKKHPPDWFNDISRNLICAASFYVCCASFGCWFSRYLHFFLRTSETRKMQDALRMAFWCFDKRWWIMMILSGCRVVNVFADM